MIQVAQQLLSLAKQLFSGGLAFTVPPQQPGTGEIYTDEAGNLLTDESGAYLVTEDYTPGYGGWLERFIKAFSGDGANRLGTLERCYNDAYSIYGHIFPLANNPYFTDGTVDPNDNDCNDYEVLLGLVEWGVTSVITPTRLQRMAAIRQKLRYPGTDAPRQSASYMQASLQSAGYPVYVYENLTNLSATEWASAMVGYAGYGTFGYGELGYGETFADSGVSVIANYIDESKDDLFIVPVGNYHGTFFIGGATPGTFATVPAVQKKSLRQLILNLKPSHMAGYMFVNYV